MACVFRRAYRRCSNLASAAFGNIFLTKKLILFFAVLLCSALIDFSQPLSAADGKSLSEAFPDGIYSALAGIGKENEIAPRALRTAVTLERKIDDGNYSDGVSSELLNFVEKIEAEKPALLKVNRPELPNDSYHAALRGAPDPGSATKAGSGDDAYSALLEFARQIGVPEQELAKPEPLQLAAVAKNPVAKRAPAADTDPTYVGSQTCLKCHSSQAAQFGETLMGRIGKTQKGKFECENCHGPGSAHAKAGGGRGVGGIISFRPEDKSRTAAENNALCLGCHDKGDRTLWQGSTHEMREVACTNCHTIMKAVSRKNQLKTAFQPDTCFQCHKNKRAEMWRTAHMPVREGKITCTNCHNPHGSFSESLLKQATVNDNCYQCHAEKRGPFLFEHAPVRENCLNCHDPHGSTNEFMLKISRPRLCQQCHIPGSGHPGNPRNPVSVFGINRECQNCHSKHHGSNSPSGARFQR
jgi:DmsE family decaheme c-type cytochrome